MGYIMELSWGEVVEFLCVLLGWFSFVFCTSFIWHVAKWVAADVNIKHFNKGASK